jgi:hypothetical protein
MRVSRAGAGCHVLFGKRLCDGWKPSIGRVNALVKVKAHPDIALVRWTKKGEATPGVLVASPEVISHYREEYALYMSKETAVLKSEISAAVLTVNWGWTLLLQLCTIQTHAINRGEGVQQEYEKLYTSENRSWILSTVLAHLVTKSKVIEDGMSTLVVEQDSFSGVRAQAGRTGVAKLIGSSDVGVAQADKIVTKDGSFGGLKAVGGTTSVATLINLGGNGLQQALSGTIKERSLQPLYENSGLTGITSMFLGALSSAIRPDDVVALTVAIAASTLPSAVPGLDELLSCKAMTPIVQFLSLQAPEGLNLENESCVGHAEAYAREVIAKVGPATTFDDINAIKAHALAKLNVAAATAGIGMFRKYTASQRCIASARADDDVLLLQQQLEAGMLTQTKIERLTQPTLMAYLAGTGKEYARRPKKAELINDFINHIRSLGYSKGSSSRKFPVYTKKQTITV